MDKTISLVYIYYLLNVVSSLLNLPFSKYLRFNQYLAKNVQCNVFFFTLFLLLLFWSVFRYLPERKNNNVLLVYEA